MWTYKQRSGDLIKDDALVSVGYSGHGDGFNNPDMEDVHGVGPIPRGLWKIGPWYDNYGPKGPVVARLSPVDFNPHGRDGFLIHGDNAEANHTASDGCLILSRQIREMMRDSEDFDLTVERE